MPEKGIEKILDDKGRILAIIGNTKEMEGKSNFITPDYFGFQTVVQNINEEDYFKAHEHKPFDKIDSLSAQEFIYVIRGELNIGIYSGKERITERKLEEGDFIILNSGHDIIGLKKPTQFILIKQGPYRGEGEKIFLK